MRNTQQSTKETTPPRTTPAPCVVNTSMGEMYRLAQSAFGQSQVVYLRGEQGEGVESCVNQTIRTSHTRAKTKKGQAKSSSNKRKQSKKKEPKQRGLIFVSVIPDFCGFPIYTKKETKGGERENFRSSNDQWQFLCFWLGLLSCFRVESPKPKINCKQTI